MSGNGINQLLDTLVSLPSVAAEREQRQLARAIEHVARDANAWPELDEAALHGSAGDFVRIVMPHTEADTAALLIQFLAGVGNMIGRHVYRVAEGAHHYPNLFAVLVGDTSHGRKGSSLAQVKKFLSRVDPLWASDHIKSGLSSGEGLIWAVRDPIERREPLKDKGRYTGEYQIVEIDPGITDKRLLAIEPEFSSVLKVANREGNTLSTTIRQAWDSGDLKTLTKTNPASATASHISIIGHITHDELLRRFDDTEAANGFGNRFLWACVKRRQLLPFGGNLRESDLDALVAQLRDVVSWSMEPREVSFSDDASRGWITAYSSLTAGRPGLLGAIIGRAEAQVLRLAMLYAVLDCSSRIEVDHLRAALAVWEYCEDSARYIFGARLGDPDADRVLAALQMRPDGMTRTDIRDLFNRHLSEDRIARSLEVLRRSNLASPRKDETGGRPAEIWIATGATKATEATKGASNG